MIGGGGGFVLITEIFSLSFSDSVSFFKWDQEKSSVCMSSLMLWYQFLYQFLTCSWKGSSTAQLVMDRVTSSHRRWFILGNMSQGHASSTSTSDGKVLSAVTSLKLLYKFCIFHNNRKVCDGCLYYWLVTKVVWARQAGSSGSQMQCVGCSLSERGRVCSQLHIHAMFWHHQRHMVNKKQETRLILFLSVTRLDNWNTIH